MVTRIDAFVVVLTSYCRESDAVFTYLSERNETKYLHSSVLTDYVLWNQSIDWICFWGECIIKSVTSNKPLTTFLSLKIWIRWSRKKSTNNLSWLDEELVWVACDVLIDQLQAEKGKRWTKIVKIVYRGKYVNNKLFLTPIIMYEVCINFRYQIMKTYFRN